MKNLAIGFFAVYVNFLFCSYLTPIHCQNFPNSVVYETSPPILQPDSKQYAVITGLENLLAYHQEKLKGKKVGIITNQTGVDAKGIPNWQRIKEIPDVEIKALFSPEHGLYGTTPAGEKTASQQNPAGIPKVFSLYGDTPKPTSEMLKDIDLLIYDIQDIGVRFYTYITTLGLAMEAAGENQIPFMVLDRPNPLTGTQVEGPVLNLTYHSFVGYYPIAIQYGLTGGELATMITEEKWIKHKPLLEVIPLSNWKREMWYDETNLIWIPPSPNIPDLITAIVYPGTCFLEATNVSEGRGSPHPFLWTGAPWIDGNKLAEEMNKKNLPGVTFSPISFTPHSIPGKASRPKYEGKLCNGTEIQVVNRNVYESVKTGIALLTTLSDLYPQDLKIDDDHLNRLSGSDVITKGLSKKLSHDKIILLYSQELRDFQKIREKYLLYE